MQANFSDKKPIAFTITQKGHQVIINENEIVKMFHQIYYMRRDQTWCNTFWLGRNILKCPLDLWIYQEIFSNLKPDIIIETGTFHGASAQYYAYLCDIIDHGKVITVDITKAEQLPEHPRVQYITGSSVSPEVVNTIKKQIGKDQKVLVVLDSDHTMSHVHKELEIYSKLVTVGSYIIVEDSNVNGNPVRSDFGPGPMEAIDEFLLHNDNFVIDSAREKFMMTQNPKGYLKRIK